MRGPFGVRLGPAVAVLAVAVLTAGSDWAGTQLVATPERPKAPGFRIQDLDRKVIELDALRHRGPVLIDFWATWCKPCLAAMPELEALHRKYGPQGLSVVGISVDGPRNHSKVRPFVSRVRITYPVAIDQDGRIQQLYQVVALPTAVLIDASGAVVMTRVGFRPGEGRLLEDKIAALLPRGISAVPDSAVAESLYTPPGDKR